MSSAFAFCRVLFVIFSALCKHEFCKMRCVFAPLLVVCGARKALGFPTSLNGVWATIMARH